MARNRITLLAAAVVLAYAIFVEWIWGWAPILDAWKKVGIFNVLLALVLLLGTYFVRAHRIQDYFASQTQGHFLKLFRLTQVHNTLNIMLPLRTGETSFPLLMRSEFGVPLAQGASALFVLRLLDLHALLAVAGLGLVAAAGYVFWAWLVWVAFILAPLVLAPLRAPLLRWAQSRAAGRRFAKYLDQIDEGIPRDLKAFLRAWGLTVVNWGIKVAVLAWVLGMMGVVPVAASFGGAMGGELSSVLPFHAPAGVGTYPAGIAAGAAAFGAGRDAASLDILAMAGINAHLLIIASALAGTGLSLLLAGLFRAGDA